MALSARQLLRLGKSKGVGPGLKAQAVSQFLSTLAHRTPFLRQDRVRHFQTIGVPRSGMYHIDYGEFHKEWAGSNSGFTGFLVAVENFSNKLFVLPCRGKDTKEWLRGIQTFVEQVRDVEVVYSDRDAVATSPRFRDEIAKKYKIAWYFLKKGNKSYLAERYIGLVKTRLSQVLLHRGGKKWIDLVEPLVKEYNREKIEGTLYTRQSITRANFLDFLGQLLKKSDPELSFHAFKVGPFVGHNDWNKKIFQFNLGDRVLVARSANWKFGEEKLKAFGKVSMLGGFGNRLFTISGRQLRATKKGDRYVAVYSLAEFGPSLHFYSNELKLAEQQQQQQQQQPNV